MLAASLVSAEFQKLALHTMNLPGPKAPQIHLGAQSLLSICCFPYFPIPVVELWMGMVHLPWEEFDCITGVKTGDY